MDREEQDKNRDGAGRFLPGASGNPGGRPRGRVGLTNRIRLLLEQPASGGSEKAVADVLAERLVAESLKNPAKMWQFIKEFLDRDEGRTDKLDIANDASPAEQAAMIRDALAQMRASVPSAPESGADDE